MDHTSSERPRSTYTAAGVLAILLWSTTIAFSRSLSEEVGAIRAGACIYLLGGVLGCLYEALVRRRLVGMFRLPAPYLVGCGLLFVVYTVSLYLAIAMSSSRQQAIEVGIINYLWPGLTLVLAVPILGTKVRAAFPAGVVLALAGAAIAPLRCGEYSPEALVENLRANPLPYGLALVAAVTWALYSNLSRRWGGRGQGGAVPLFVLATGAAMAGVHLAFPEPAAWTARAAAEVLYMAALPTLLAYAFWDAAMRRGNVILVAAISYLTPLLSTAISVVYLGVAPGWNLWAACALVIAGAGICQRSVAKQAV
jgi:drug/metabolite transporter (DMT)-like permease